MDEERLRGVHRWLHGNFGPGRSALYVASTAFLAIALSGFVAYLLRQPLFLLVLGPTAFSFFRAPMAPSASPRNAVIGQFVGLTIGFFTHAAIGLPDAWGVLQGGAVSFAHVGAVALSTGLTGAVLLALRAWHSPATVTAFVASLGLLGGPSGLFIAAAGVVLVTAIAWAINRTFGVPAPAWGTEE